MSRGSRHVRSSSPHNVTSHILGHGDLTFGCVVVCTLQSTHKPRTLGCQVHVVCPVSEPCWVFDNLYKIFVHYITSLSTAKRHSMFPLIKTSGMSVYLFSVYPYHHHCKIRRSDVMYFLYLRFVQQKQTDTYNFSETGF